MKYKEIIDVQNHFSDLNYCEDCFLDFTCTAFFIVLTRQNSKNPIIPPRVL